MLWRMQAEKTNHARVGRLLEHVVSAHLLTAADSSSTFRQFCEVLGERGYQWLVRDLSAELRVERGDVRPRPDLLHETAALVHRSRIKSNKWLRRRRGVQWLAEFVERC